VGLVAVVALVGVAAAIVVSRRHEDQPEFLDGVLPLAVAEAKIENMSSETHGSTTYYSFEGDWEEVYRRAKAEMPDAIERETRVGGTVAKVLTVPRIEGGRRKMFFPPEREILIFAHKLVVGEGGHVQVRIEEGESWASVQVSTYRQPHFLDDAVDWVRDRLRI
jgi:hypothetical protein